MSDNEEVALAYLLYRIYWEAIGGDHWAWEELTPQERTAWVFCAQFVLSSYVVRDNNTPDHK